MKHPENIKHQETSNNIPHETSRRRKRQHQHPNSKWGAGTDSVRSRTWGQRPGESGVWLMRGLKKTTSTSNIKANCNRPFINARKASVLTATKASQSQLPWTCKVPCCRSECDRNTYCILTSFILLLNTFQPILRLCLWSLTPEQHIKSLTLPKIAKVVLFRGLCVLYKFVKSICLISPTSFALLGLLISVPVPTWSRTQYWGWSEPYLSKQVSERLRWYSASSLEKKIPVATTAWAFTSFN